MKIREGGGEWYCTILSSKKNIYNNIFNDQLQQK